MTILYLDWGVCSATQLGKVPSVTIIYVLQEPRNVYVYRDGDARVWNVTSRLPDAHLTEDSQILVTGQHVPMSWTLSAYAYGPALMNHVERVAELRYPSDLTILAQPTKMALQYLDLPEAYVFEPQRAPGRPAVYWEARQRITVQLSRTLLADLDTLARHEHQTRTAYMEQVLAEHVKGRLHPDGE